MWKGGNYNVWGAGFFMLYIYIPSVIKPLICVTGGYSGGGMMGV